MNLVIKQSKIFAASKGIQNKNKLGIYLFIEQTILHMNINGSWFTRVIQVLMKTNYVQNKSWGIPSFINQQMQQIINLNIFIYFQVEQAT